MINIKSFVLKVEAEAVFEALARSLAFFFLNKSGKLKYDVIFHHKGKSIHQGSPTLLLESYHPADFSSNPAPTHLSEINK